MWLVPTLQLGLGNNIVPNFDGSKSLKLFRPTRTAPSLSVLSATNSGLSFSVRPDKPLNVPFSSGVSFLLMSTSPHPEQSNRSITFKVLPSQSVWKNKLYLFNKLTRGQLIDSLQVPLPADLHRNQKWRWSHPDHRSPDTFARSSALPFPP